MQKIRYAMVLTFGLLLCLSVQSVAQGSFSFHQLSRNDGLPDNWVHDALLDSRGWMWFATQDGIARFDGTNFKNYRSTLGDSTSLIGNVVMGVAEDSKGMLWFTSNGGGLHRFDPIQERFTSWQHNPDDVNSPSCNTTFTLYIDEADKVWVGTFEGGLFNFDPREEVFRRIPLVQELSDPSRAFVENSVMSIDPDQADKNILWLGSNNGLYRLDKRDLSLQHFVSPGNVTAALSIRDCFDRGDGYLWLATNGYGLVRWHKTRHTWEPFFTDEDAFFEEQFLENNYITSVASKSDTELWIGTVGNGLAVFDISAERFQQFSTNDGEAGNIRSNDIWNMYHDPDGKLWIFHFPDGISYTTPEQQAFRYFDIETDNSCVPNDELRATDFAFHPERKELYVSTSGCDGLYVFSETGKQLRQVPITTADNNPVEKMLLDRSGQLWLVLRESETKCQLWKYDTDTRQVKRVRANQQGTDPQNYVISDLVEDSKGNIWISTFFGGLYRTTSTQTYIEQVKDKPLGLNFSLSELELKDLLLSPDGQLWIATLQQGILRFDVEMQAAEQLPISQSEVAGGLAGNRFNTLAWGEDGRVYTGTNSLGTQIINPKDIHGEMPMLSQAEGFLDDKISKIISDSLGQLWISTMRGLVGYHPVSKRYLEFTDQNGLKNAYLWETGLQALSNGRLAVGQFGGFYYFDPQKILPAERAPAVKLTQFSIFEEPQQYERELNFVEKITLHPKQNFFSFGYTALNYDPTAKLRFAYRLEGVDPEWRYPEAGRQIASYTNVPAGTYNFQIKAANANEDWGPTHRIAVQVLPPWYATWWAYGGYLLLLSALIFGAFRLQKRRWKLRTQLALGQQEAQRLKELDDLKTRLYANITHEFRTPLTIILGMTQQLSGDDNIRSMIQRNGQRLLHLVNQMLDLSRLEKGGMEVALAPTAVMQFLEYLTESFQPIAQERGIRLVFHADPKNLNSNIDREKVQQCISNLLVNAFKFTPEGGRIFVFARTVDAQILEIKVEDSGTGIAPEDIPHIFNRFYQTSEARQTKNSGTGIGLALTRELVSLLEGSIEVQSKLGEGTTFTIRLPLLVTKTAEPTQPSPVLQENLALAQAKLAPISVDTATENDGDTNLPLLLIIEDNPDIIAFLQTCLGEQYQILTAHDGEKGVETAFANIPDIIICDVMMPKMDGFAACRILKNDDRTSHIPVILLTAKSTEQDKIQGLSEGADAYLKKPFNQKELLIRLRKLLELRSTLQQRYAHQEIAAPSTTPVETKQDDFVHRLNEIIALGYPNEDFGVAELCRGMALSRTQLHRKLKALTGQSTTEYLRNFRLRQAKVLLETTQSSISEIAYQVGFSDPGYFTKTFRERFGKTPTDIRM